MISTPKRYNKGPAMTCAVSRGNFPAWRRPDGPRQGSAMKKKIIAVLHWISSRISFHEIEIEWRDR
jgi:hypothetical protein